MIPYGSAEILQLRKDGKRPADMVLVSLAGAVRGESNPVVYPGNHDYDWRFLRGLQVTVLINAETPAEKSRKVIREIEAVEPAYLGLVERETGNGVKVLFGTIEKYTNAGSDEMLERYTCYKPKHPVNKFTKSEVAAWK